MIHNSVKEDRLNWRCAFSYGDMSFCHLGIVIFCGEYGRKWFIGLTSAVSQRADTWNTRCGGREKTWRVSLSICRSHFTILPAIQVRRFYEMLQGIMNNPIHHMHLLVRRWTTEGSLSLLILFHQWLQDSADLLLVTFWVRIAACFIFRTIFHAKLHNCVSRFRSRKTKLCTSMAV